MGDASRKPYSREEFRRALVLNALFSPLNVVLLTAMVVAGILLGQVVLMLPIAAVVYGIAAARTFFDEDVAEKVLERERASRRAVSGRAAQRPQLDLTRLAPPIANLVGAARAREMRVDQAIASAELPFTEVSSEVGAFTVAIEGTARRAQILWDALADTPPDAVRARLAQVRDDPSKTELTAALETQLATLQRMQGQLDRFFTQMERMLVELDTIRSQLVSASASTESSRQEELADEVRALREQVGAVADGMAETYERGT